MDCTSRGRAVAEGGPRDQSDIAGAPDDAALAPAPQALPDAQDGGPLPLQEFFIPVHGLIRIGKHDELAVVDHPAFQRLGNVYQLGQTYLVYRGATHTRYEHALGTRHVVELMIDALRRNSSNGRPDPDNRDGDWALGERLTEVEKTFTRLGALLHDIGHLPAGHTIEDELGLLGAHDRAERLHLVWDRTRWDGVVADQTLREVIDEKFGQAAAQSGLQHASDGRALSATEIVELLISKEPPAVQPAEFRVQVCRDLIGNTICADLLDYLHRDWHHIGKERFFDTRLLEYLEIRTAQTPDGPSSDLVINLRSGSRIRTDAVTAILDLLESRYQLAEIALFHRTKLSATAMLERAIAEIGEHYPGGSHALLEVLQERLLDATDMEMLSILGDIAAEEIGRTGSSRDPNRRAALEGALRLTKDLRSRRLYKHLTSAFEYELNRAARAVQDQYAGSQTGDRQVNARTGAANRLTALRLLERDFDLRPASLVMYCPPRTMNTKIAEVKVLVHGSVHPLDRFEGDERSDRGITGGHLAAQKDRFRRLWRVQFAIERTERDRLASLGLLQLLGRAIDLCVLRREPAIGTIDEAVAALAKELSTIDGSPLAGRRIVAPIAARQSQMLAYPGGAISLLDHAADEG